MPTETPSDDSSSERSKQHIWPIFVLAAALMAFGGYFVFFTATPREASVEPMPAEFTQPSAPPETTALEGPVTLRYATLDRSFRLDLRQRQIRGSRALSTWIRSDVTDTSAEGANPAAVVRTYADTVVATYADGEPVGTNIVDEVEKLIDTAAHRLRIDATGEVVEADVATTESPQIREVLDLMQDGASLLFVRVPREPVREGEPWKWSAPAPASDPTATAAAPGGATFLQAQVAGRDSAGHPILIVELQSALFDSQTTGKGWVRWDQAAQGPAESHLFLTQTRTVGGEPVTTKYALRLSNFTLRE